MDTPPVPKPRSTLLSQNELKHPVPLPRTKVSVVNERRASDIFRSISTASKQLTEDVATKVTNSVQTANEKIEKSIQDGSKFAKGTLEKTLTTSRAMRDSVTKSVIEGTRHAGQRLRRSRKSDCQGEDGQRCTSLPVVDVSLFDNIQFHSPLLEQKKNYQDVDNVQSNQELPFLNLNASHLDDLSLFSSNSDSNTDTVSNFSYDSSRDDHVSLLTSEGDQMTYDTPTSSRANSIVSVKSAPEVPERRKKRGSRLEIMRQNSLYENWTLPFHSSNNPYANPSNTSQTNYTERPSQSTIFEFDPLNTSKITPKYEGVSNELILLESFLIGDTYGTIVTADSNEEIDYFPDSEYFNPPTPPERSDSLFPENGTKGTQQVAEDKDRNSNWFITETDIESKLIDDGAAKPTNSTNSVMQRFSNMLKLDRTGSLRSSKVFETKVGLVERPPVNSLPVPFFSGTLTKIVSGVVEDLFKNSQSRYCVLSDQKLMCYSDPTNTVLKEAYVLDHIFSLQIVLPLSSSTTSNSYCFELAVSGGARGAPRKVLFSCASASERRNWAQKMAEHLTSAFPTKYTAEYTRVGWCYLKEGVTGEWRGAWVMLIRRVLVYYTTASETGDACTVDLRKTRCVVTQDADEETKQSCPTDGSGSLLLDCPTATLYLRFPHERELKAWRYMVKLAAHNNGAHIHHQQLTKDDVPAIVDKCLSFIYAHGSLSEGVYRRAGSSVVLSELLARFRRDAWSVQLAPGQHSEHDVAGVLKRFFRDLPEPLLPQATHRELVDALLIVEEDARHAELRRLVTSLPLVARNTARRLFAHLHFIHSMAHTNKMNAENLASVWAPTVMPAALTSNTLQTAWSAKEVFVVRDLIVHYEAIWQPTEGERRREAAVRRVLMRVLSHSAPTTPKAAGDLRTWVYVKDRATCCQIALTPNKTSSDVCIELCEKANMESHLLMLEEVICNDSMRRIVHVDEIVLDVVLRWSYWDEEDRKHNYLIISENKILHEIEALRHSTTLVCGELRLASDSSRTFKLHMFEFQNTKLCYFKDKQGSHKIEEWDVKDILWYVGHEPKRNPQSRWAITFIPRNNKPKRCKDKPYFGCTIAGAVTEDRLKWIAAMTFGEHANILPTPRLVIT